VTVNVANRIDSARLDDSLWLIELHGEHDLSTAAELDAVLADVASSGTTVVVDLSAATFIDSSIISRLVRFHQSGERLLLVTPHEHAITRIVEMFGLAALFPFFESQTAALIEAQTNSSGICAT
jgi:anti-sigma B factor antagonist